MKQGGLFAPISREGALVFNNLFLVAAAATVLVGTLYPLGLEALTGAKISVGAPFYNLTFVPLMVPLLMALPFGPMLAWKRGDLPGAAQRLGVAIVAALAAAALTYVVEGGKGLLAPFGLGLGAWLICGSLADAAERSQLFRAPPSVSLARLAGLPRSAFGTMVAHAGIGLTVIGIVCTSAYQTEKVVALKPGETVEVGGYALIFQGTAPATGPNYTEERAQFAASRDGAAPFPMVPSKRYFSTRGMVTTEAAIKTIGFSQLYVSLGDQMDSGSVAVRASYKPLVTLIWLGAFVMAIGGGLSLSDRRLRIGAPRRALARRAAATA
jgi:cytochrome c-type biogenesis protein CcmF